MRPSAVISFSALAFATTASARIATFDAAPAPRATELALLQRTAPAPTAACPPAAPAASDQSLEAERSRLRVELAQRQVERASWAEAPAEWPAQVHPMLEPTVLLFHLSRALDEDQETLAMECEEFPCVVAVTGKSVPTGSPHTAFDATHERLAESGFEDLTLPIRSARPMGDGMQAQSLQVFAYSDGTHDERRLRTRVERLMDDLWATEIAEAQQ